MMIEFVEREMLRESGHHRVEIDERHTLDRRVLQYLTQRQAISAAEHEHAFWVAVERRKCGMNQRLVISVFIERVELQVAVQEECSGRSCPW